MLLLKLIAKNSQIYSPHQTENKMSAGVYETEVVKMNKEIGKGLGTSNKMLSGCTEPYL